MTYTGFLHYLSSNLRMSFSGALIIPDLCNYTTSMHGLRLSDLNLLYSALA